MIHFKVPDNAVKYILFQRAGYLVFNNNKILNKLFYSNSIFPYEKALIFESVIFKNRIKNMFINDMLKEYKNIENSLPKNAKSILDVGCGVAGIDVFISNHYKNNNINFYLLDKSKIDKKVYYNFNLKGSFYNSLSASKSLLVNNGIKPNNIKLQEVNENCVILFKQKFDLVISLISWGYHYPVTTYLNQVYDLMNINGVLIIDISLNNS